MLETKTGLPPKAAERATEIVGEASKQIPNDIRSQVPEIPWQAMAGMRDRVSHAYFGVGYDILREVITEDIPPLIPKIQAMIRTLKAEQE